MIMNTFEAGGKLATLYPGKEEGSPLIVLNGDAGEGASVLQALGEIDAPDCSLLVVDHLDWNHDMAPWDCPPLRKNESPITGGADDYLQLLLTQILPEARTLLGASPRFVGVAGYSLAGLFALYALYRCDAFDRAASMSGSLWFPSFTDFVRSHDMKRAPEKLYLSLGDKEAKTRNPYLKTVQENTEAAVQLYRDMGLDVTWELNPGNHFRDAELRSAKGILGIL